MSSKDSEIPRVIPEIEWVNGEPVIAQKMVVAPSPIPRSVAVIMILLAVFSVAYIVFQQAQRDADNDREAARAQSLLERVQENQEDLEEQQVEAEAEREALRGLVGALVSTDSAEKRRELLLEFIQGEAERKEQNGAGDPTPTPAASARPTPRPSPSGRRSPRPKPKPSGNPTPTSSPTPQPLLTCLPAPPPLGSVCL